MVTMAKNNRKKIPVTIYLTPEQIGYLQKVKRKSSTPVACQIRILIDKDMP